ncbi:aldose epimerase family protein [Streptomyces sp. AM8-1-1]|uniref:aldose epimerase family protein n=1 Tax=Streptomyces sp. AM8-1-1 TaxID=3075825 RepID=UPI0028C4119E|nr:aldose epimerase family protein [Streptomyces sp. AM8-1-1]WNO76690.1 aldose epimerase family protein [Streptomyces sp. AM8-1-1]
MKTSRRTVMAAAAAGLAATTTGTTTAHAHPHGSEGGQPERELFGKLADGTKVYRWLLANGGTRLKVLSYGGIVQSLEIPDRHGRYKNVSLGFDSLEEYVASSPYFGALIGRYGNRIARGKFSLDGKAYQVSVNDGENSLHGGSKGFDKRGWDVESFTSGSDIGLVLHYTSIDGEMGYPGTLRVKVRYTLTRRGDWRVDYAATTDKATVVNLTSHVYWNLAGEDGGSVYDHELSIGASRYTPVDSGLIPTGALAKVAGTPFDYRRPKTVGEDIRVAHEQLLYGQGFDHNWVLDKGNTNVPQQIATLRDPASGRVLDIATTEPGLQFYSGNFLDGTLVGSGGTIHRQGDALCLETQHFPDSPNQPSFPSTVLRPGDTYRSTTVHRFSAR